ncbi:KH domain-containing, RNA-binding, signal transduction-associated protein 2-like isoform X1 [Sitodiplosis mosellana]|uniref:KH domain-containing, RNA-binding, signal transduction-associated protein 2-like isoform X1 n=1 Tax=Sitodiplosis mosellana TaxID=263140 RepID=UPI002444A1AA|nr:KH domain-containing, RNA-binding, signal transduction-associated protein 2-like isoform X1 [Sitodiplosis mosellana]
MAEYEGNGDFNYSGDGSSDFKRRDNNATTSVKSDDEAEENVQLPEKVNEYIRELLNEKMSMDHKYPHAEKLLEAEIAKVQQSGRIPQREQKYVDIYREKQIRVTVKVLVPVKEHPKFNFVGKLLGPKGNSMKRLQEETMCKMAVLGRGSMKDRKKEEDLRAALDPKYAHLNDDLHVEISALAPPAEAHARVAYALAEVRKYLIPDSNDVIRQEQLRELIADGTIPSDADDPAKYKPRVPHIARNAYPSSRVSATTRSPVPAGSSRTVMPAKQKILSILDRARTAMEETYPAYEDAIYEGAPTGHYDNYSYGHQAHTSAPRTARYDAADYEAEYRREYYREPPAYAAHRSSWKSSSYHGNGSYSSSGRHEHEHVSSSAKAAIHSSHSRESRYRNSPYTRPKN